MNMKLLFQKIIGIGIGIYVALALLAACSSPMRQAPVEERSLGKKNNSLFVESIDSYTNRTTHLYTVKPGDTLYRIAREYQKNPQDLVEWNQLNNNAPALHVGQTLRLTAPPSTFTPTHQANSVQVSGMNDAPVQSESLNQQLQNRPPLIFSNALENTQSENAQSAPHNSAPHTNEPKGAKMPYSEQAWASAQTHATAKNFNTSESKAEIKAEDSPALSDSDAEEPIDWAWPTEGGVLATYDESKNKGLDLGGSLGAPVFAAASGKVVYVGNGLRGYGNFVIIKHTGSMLSVYAHNKVVLVRDGQMVVKGQKIAEMGSSDTQQIKLHFEIRRHGKPVDPTEYLPVRYEKKSHSIAAPPPTRFSPS